MTRAVDVDRQAELRLRAEALFPGGVNSPVRAFRAVGVPPIILAGGDDAWVRDADGRRYLDLISSWGATILGHAHPAVTAAVTAALADGLALGATHPSEVVLGEAIRAAMPAMERLRFTSSGTEAVMSAVRLARAATGRELIVRFGGSYHGHSDGLLVDAGSGLSTLAIPGSAGVPAAVAAGSVVIPFNDPAAISRAFRDHPGRIAAVLVEPVMANVGVVAPDAGFLEQLREETRANSALLVFDEVITGFRLGMAGAQGRFGVTPDLTALGKVIGGGMPVGAYGGRADLMALVAPEGPVYQAGTLSGHPLAMAAGAAVLSALRDDAYAALEARVGSLADGLRAAAREAHATAVVSVAGPLLSVSFQGQVPRDGAAALASDREAFGRFFRAMLAAGVLLPPSPFEAWFPGFAHGHAELELVLGAAPAAFAAAVAA
jgi:glutamate-1-semialdehyde 2,1-aminomutase